MLAISPVYLLPEHDCLSSFLPKGSLIKSAERYFDKNAERAVIAVYYIHELDETELEERRFRIVETGGLVSNDLVFIDTIVFNNGAYTLHVFEDLSPPLPSASQFPRWFEFYTGVHDRPFELEEVVEIEYYVREMIQTSKFETINEMMKTNPKDYNILISKILLELTENCSDKIEMRVSYQERAPKYGDRRGEEDNT